MDGKDVVFWERSAPHMYIVYYTCTVYESVKNMCILGLHHFVLFGEVIVLQTKNSAQSARVRSEHFSPTAWDALPTVRSHLYRLPIYAKVLPRHRVPRGICEFPANSVGVQHTAVPCV